MNTSKTTNLIFDSSPVPRYIQLAEVFRHRIERNVWPPGSILPSIEALMQEFSVGRVTVRQAIKLLSTQGLVSPHRGKGTFVNDLGYERHPLRVETTLNGLVEIYRGDKPVLTNIAESGASPVLMEGDGASARSYYHLKRVHARNGIKYCVISIYIDETIFRKAENSFKEGVILPVLVSTPGVIIDQAKQSLYISKADVEIASLLDIPIGEPTAEVRRVLTAPDGTVIYVADITYRGDYIHLDMDLKA